MKNIVDIQYYTEEFIERIISEILSIYDLWSIHPLENLRKELISGSYSDVENFSDFIYNHSNQDYPFNLLIFVGNGEKNYPTIMFNKTKKVIKIRFDHIYPNSIGRPLILPY